MNRDEFPVLVEFKDVFPKEIPILPLKRDFGFFYRTHTRITSGFQIPLPHECTRIGGTQTAVAGVYTERVYMTQCVPLASTNTFRKE